jgi:PAS domain S-box-containing protein
MTTSQEKPKSNLTRRMLVLCGTIALLQTIFACVLGFMINDTFEQMEKVKRAKNVVGSLSRLSNLTQAMTIGVLESVTSRGSQRNPDAYVQRYRPIAGTYPRELSQLQRELRNYPEVKKEFKDLVDGYQEGVDLMAKLRQNLGEDSRQHYFLLFKLQEASNSTTEQLEKLETKFTHVEQAASEELKTQSVEMIVFTIAAGVLLNLGIAFLLFRYVFVQVTNRLKVVADNTVNIAMGKPLSEQITGNDEIAQLDTAIRDLGHTLNDYKSKERTILDNAAGFICSLNDKGVFIEVNQASSALWGYSPDELIGRRLSSLILPEETTSTLAAIDYLFNRNEAVSFENTVRKKDGSHIELVWSAQPGDDSGSVVMIAHDITERNRVQNLIRESEEQFRTIIDSLPVAVLTLNSTFQITAANPTTTAMFQYHANELLGRDFSILFTSGNASGADDGGMVKAAQTHSIELQSYRKDRTPLAVSLNVNRYSSRGNYYFLAVLQDITTRREIENVKRDFIAMISHDLRSPLTSLHGTLGMMAAQLEDARETMQSATDENEREILIEAEYKVGKLVHLINDFLDLEKIESGSFAFETKEVSVLKLVSLSDEKLKETCPDMDRTLTCDSQDSFATFRVDLDRVILAIVSFASAVIRFSPEVHDVSVSAERTPGRVSMFISSQGCKIPQNTRETCLKRYAIVDLAQHDTWTVSGLSLALARATVEAHRGTLEIETRDGNDGFSISLPA